MLCSRDSFEQDIKYPHFLPRGESRKPESGAAADGGEAKQEEKEEEGREKRRSRLVVSDLESAIRDVLDKHYPTPELEMIGMNLAVEEDEEAEEKNHDEKALNRAAETGAAADGGKEDALPAQS